MEKNYQESNLEIRCGKETDSYDKLEELCEKEAEKLAKTIKVSDGAVVKVPCWTNDTHELICVVRFERGNDGSVVYTIDTSESTL